MTTGSSTPFDSTLPATTRLESLLRTVASYWLPGLLLILTIWAGIQWSNAYPIKGGQTIAFRVLNANGADPARRPTAADFHASPVIERWDSRLSEHPIWVRLDLGEGDAGQRRVLDFPSRHAVSIACWNADDETLLGTANRLEQTGDFQWARGGFALTMPAPSRFIICQAAFQGPARFTAREWSQAAHLQKEFEFHRNSGLLDGGLLVLAAFILIAGLINGNSQYLLFACWLVINLRMAALSAGWDYHWLGYVVPAEYLTDMRAITLALFYLVTVVLYRSLFGPSLQQIGHLRWTQRAQWTCVPVLLAALWLPYAQFLPFIWVMSGITTVVLGWLLVRILVETRSRVAMWYGASIAVTLFASFYEVVSAALGFKGLIGTVNSVTAALASSLLVAVAVAEQMRQEQQAHRALQQELQHTYQVIPVGLFTLDPEGRFLSANPALIEMLGCDVMTLEHNHWERHFGPRDWQALLDRATLGEAVDMEMNLSPALGAGRRFLVQATWAGGKIEGSLQDITDKARAMGHLEFLANHDPLTRVLNRRGIETALADGLTQLQAGAPLAVAYLDLDRFKLINDLYGHTAGDDVLQQVCARIEALLQAPMRLGRVGGDEFLIVMPQTELRQATDTCRSVLDGLRGAPYRVGDRAFQVNGSLGLLEVTPGATAKDIVATADRACRSAKTAPVNGLQVYDQASSVFAEHEAEMQLVERLAAHDTIDGLFIEMQPIMSLRSPYTSLNFEVLLRMHDAEGRRVPTPRLIQAGEHAGRMSAIDRWVLSTTLDWLRTHQNQLVRNQFVCMNLSGASLNDERFTQDAFALLEQAGPVAHRLCLEVTESVALNDTGNTRRFIERVRSFGAKVALDDFGAGYTSFSYLKDLPADLLKIDGSFIVNMNRHPANIAIVEAIVSLAQNLGMKTIAEWAEDFETVETLAEIGVDYVQGFVVARPQSTERIAGASSGADFIQDKSLLCYLSSLADAPQDGHVDWVLGDHPPSATPAGPYSPS